MKFPEFRKSLKINDIKKPTVKVSSMASSAVQSVVVSSAKVQQPTEREAILPANKVAAELAKGDVLSVVRLLDALVEQAYTDRASDLHFDPMPQGLAIRFRVDGVLLDSHFLPKKIQDEIIARIKILSGLRTDEHQAAQDGRFRLPLPGTEQSVDVRTSIVPTYYGENAVLRLLSDNAAEYTLDSLGFSASNQEKIFAAIKKPYGMILATGPTGSGKTTTLYTLIKMLNTRDASIITIEDPIEYSLPGINQIQVNSRTGLTFANGLRSVLRQDPNIIMVGEIRDQETAGIAVNTALTGHLVLSTLHTNDASTTLPRLLDMKVESYLIATTVNVAIGQRLVRQICNFCKVSRSITPAEIKSLSGVIPVELLKKGSPCYKGEGCEKCGNTGYRGRVGIHEVLVPDAAIRDAILKRASASDIRKIAIASGMITMVEDGFEKALKGITTIEEVLRMLYE